MEVIVAINQTSATARKISEDSSDEAAAGNGMSPGWFASAEDLPRD
jgi:hypothetical protein